MGTAATDCQRERLQRSDVRSFLQKLLGSSLLVLANKQDLPGALPPDEIGQTLQLSAIHNLHWKMLGCSAFTGIDGLLEGIDWMLDDISSRLYLMD
ncbi:hypothetical protein V5799_007602 [Amblyomma americanum]|uniref:Uncharacterized protein n=1 Tax=Amblyomma americanum TaxID=6943 RepID=A0AAQ4FGW2_AMBAM